MTSLSEFYSEPPAIASSLWAMFDEGSRKHADNTSVTAMHQPYDHLTHLRPNGPSPSNNTSCLKWNFADLRHATLLVAKAFHKRGVQRGTTFVTLMTNNVECVLASWVAAILQLMLVPLDPRLLDDGREEQLRDYMRRLRPAVVTVPGAEGAEKVDKALAAEKLEGGLKLTLAASALQCWQEFGSIVPIGSKPLDTDDSALAQDLSLDRDGKRVAAILFTSSTSSGKPKGCPRTVRNLLCGTAGNFAFPDVPMRAIMHTPNSGAIGTAFILLFGSTGRHLIIPAPTFSASAALDGIEQHGAELMVAIPVMSGMFEKEVTAQQRDLSSLRRIAVGGDMVTIDAKEKFEALFPSAKVMTAHGMTEGHSIIGWRGHRVPWQYPQYHSILGAGHANPGSLVRICDEDGNVLPRREAGELHLGGPLVIDHYLENAQPEAFYRDEKGHWVRTGDRALMDEDGVIFIIGRIKDIIKRVGMALSPAVAESVLNRIDGVEASVFGVPHPDYGELPMAIVKSPEHAADSIRIKNVVTDSLGSDYALCDVKSLADIGFEAWPLNATGKIAKHELKSAYLSRFAS